MLKPLLALFALLHFLALLEPPHDQRVATFGSDQQSPAVPQPSLPCAPGPDLLEVVHKRLPSLASRSPSTTCAHSASRRFSLYSPKSLRPRIVAVFSGS